MSERRPAPSSDLATLGLVRDRRGAHLVEYMLITGVVALLVMGGFRFFGRAVEAKARSQARAVAALEAGDAAPGDGSSEDGDDGGGGLWGAIRDVAGGAKDLAGGAVDLAGDAFKQATDFQLGFAKGMLHGASDVVTGIFHAATHPVETFQGLSYAANHPFETLWTMGKSYVDRVAADPAEGLGYIGLDIASSVLTSGSAGVLSQTAKGTKVIKGVNNADTVQSIAGAGDASSDNRAPGFVEWADRNVAPWIMPQLPRPRFP